VGAIFFYNLHRQSGAVVMAFYAYGLSESSALPTAPPPIVPCMLCAQEKSSFSHEKRIFLDTFFTSSTFSPLLSSFGVQTSEINFLQDSNLQNFTF